MRSFSNIKAFLAHLMTLPAEIEAAQKRGEEEAGERLVKYAVELIGTEEPTWDPLAASTVARKETKGQTGRVSSTDPLYATGEMRLSISYRIEGGSLLLGATDPVAPFHEFGTSRMPERSFIGRTMFVEGHAASDIIANHIVSAVSGNRPRRNTRQ